MAHVMTAAEQVEANYQAQLKTLEAGKESFSDVFAAQAKELKSLQAKLSESPISYVQQTPVIQQQGDNKGLLYLMLCIGFILMFGRNMKLFGFKLRR